MRSGIVVQIAQTTRLDIPLQVGDMSEEVQVVAEAPLVRSTTAELGQVIEMKQIQALPLNGRFFQHLITHDAGRHALLRPRRLRGERVGGGRRIATAHTVNGMPWSGNNYLLDGVVNNELQNAYINITPPARGHPGVQGPDQQPHRGVRRVRRRRRQPHASARARTRSTARCSTTCATTR